MEDQIPELTTNLRKAHTKMKKHAGSYRRYIEFEEDNLYVGYNITDTGS